MKENEHSNSQLVLMPIRGAVIKEEEELVVTEVKRPKVKIKLTGLAEDEAGGQDQDQEGSKFEEMLGLQRRGKEDEDYYDEEDGKLREKENGGTSEVVERTNMTDFEEMLGLRQLEKTED